MKNIAVIFGGRSVEHDISILTGLHAAKHVESYRVHYVYITRDNRMMTGQGLANLDNYISGKVKGKPVHFANGHMYIKNRQVKIEAVLNCCHGGVGENGELAGYFAVASVPVTSCGYFAAAQLQSKSQTREVLTKAGFNQPRYIVVEQSTEENYMEVLKANKIDFPVIVKPDTLGSSIGINVARDEGQLDAMLTLAFSLDDRVIVEEFLPDIQEINCSAIGDEVSACEEISNKGDFLNFETKYLDSGSGFIKKGKSRGNSKKIQHEDQIKELTKKTYKLFEASGVVRADFMVSGEKIYLNEMNTVPGFLSYHLWARSGIPYGVMIDKLVKQCVASHNKRQSRVTQFKSDILVKNKRLLD